MTAQAAMGRIDDAAALGRLEAAAARLGADWSVESKGGRLIVTLWRVAPGHAHAVGYGEGVTLSGAVAIALERTT